MSVFSNVITPQGWEPLQFPTKFRSHSVVLPNGTVGDVTVIRSLDRVFGLDDEARKAARQWRFAPGTRFGTPVAVAVVLELFFSLR